MKDSLAVDYVIGKLNEIFNVKDISNELTTAENLDEAKNIHLCKHFDIVPIKKDGNIDSFYDCHSDSEIQIKPENILCESIGIFETLSYLSKKDFFFILSGNSISEIVHYSDLNSELVKMVIYAHIAYCETAIRKFARSINPNKDDYSGEKFLNDLKKSSGVKINVNMAKKQFEEKKSSNTETDLFDELYFGEELILLREIIKSNPDANNGKVVKNSINLDDAKITFLNQLRNEVMHAKSKIIKKQPDISKWLKFLQDCRDIISFIG